LEARSNQRSEVKFRNFTDVFFLIMMLLVTRGWRSLFSLYKLFVWHS
jgi:hypothetical protein